MYPVAMAEHVPPQQGPAGLRLLRQGFAYSLAQILLRAGNFLLVPLYTSMLATAEYGLVGVLGQLGQAAVVLALCGQQNALLRLAVDVERDPARLEAVVATQMRWVFSASWAALLLLAAGWPLLRPYLDGEPLFPLGAAMLLGLSGSSVFQLTLSWLQLQGKSKEHAYLSLERWGVSVAAALLFVLAFRWGAAGILLAQSVGWWYGALRGRRFLPRPLPPAEPGTRRRSLAYGLPILPHSLAGVLILTTDRTLIAGHVGLDAAGVYTLAVNLASAVFIVAQGMQGAWLPFFLREDRDRGEHGWERVRRLSYFVLTGVAAVALFVGLFGHEIVALMAPARYAAATLVLPGLCFASFLRAFYLMFSAVILAEPKAARWIAAVTVPAALLNVALNASLIPRHGIDGAVWAALGGHGLAALLSFALARRARAVPFKYGSALLLSASVLGLLSAAPAAGLLLRSGAFVLWVGFAFALDHRDLRYSARPLLARIVR
jgi:O-antigen/teichoic acid export membrane protein